MWILDRKQGNVYWSCIVYSAALVLQGKRSLWLVHCYWLWRRKHFVGLSCMTGTAGLSGMPASAVEPSLLLTCELSALYEPSLRGSIQIIVYNTHNIKHLHHYTYSGTVCLT